jgi:hypothetical protein
VVDLSIFFEQFKREKQLLAGGAAATLRSYSQSWLAFVRYYGCACPPLTAARLKSWVIVMASEGNAISHSFMAFRVSLEL